MMNRLFSFALLIVLNEIQAKDALSEFDIPKGVAVVVGCSGEGRPFAGPIAHQYFNESLNPLDELVGDIEEEEGYYGNHDHSSCFDGRETILIDVSPAHPKNKCKHIQISWFDFVPSRYFKEPIDVLFFENFPPRMRGLDEMPSDLPALVEAIRYGTHLLARGGDLIVEVVPDVAMTSDSEPLEPKDWSPFVGLYPADFNVWKQAYLKIKEFKKLRAAMDLLEKEVPLFKESAQDIFVLPSLSPQELLNEHYQDFFYGIATLATILDKTPKMISFLKELGYINVSLQCYRDNPLNHRRISYHLKGTKPLLTINEFLKLQRAFDLYQKNQLKTPSPEKGA
ncbi:MAG: hypothetical protein FJX71_01125 [Alphaproteobacteria bacterium]|nr:hypothetical protein [Alphaproteobacteria bacterium]